MVQENIVKCSQLLLPTHAIFYPLAVDIDAILANLHIIFPQNTFNMRIIPGPPSFISFKQKHIPSDKIHQSNEVFSSVLFSLVQS